MLAYTKIFIKDEILKSDLPDNSFFDSVLLTEFPDTLNKQYKAAIKDHILKREIIATNISNDMINTMGISFPIRLHNETGASISEIATAYFLSSSIFKIDALETSIHALDGKVSVELQYELLHTVRVLLNMSCRWFLQRRRLKQNLNEILDYYSSSIDTLKTIIPSLIRGSTKEYVSKLVSKIH